MSKLLESLVVNNPTDPAVTPNLTIALGMVAIARMENDNFLYENIISYKRQIAVTPVAQVNTYTPVVQNSHTYKITIHQQIAGASSGNARQKFEYTIVSDATATATEICDAMRTLINAEAENGVAGSGAATLILTADTAGKPFEMFFSTVDWAETLTTANVVGEGQGSALATLKADSSKKTIYHFTGDDPVSGNVYTRHSFVFDIPSRGEFGKFSGYRAQVDVYYNQGDADYANNETDISRKLNLSGSIAGVLAADSITAIQNAFRVV